MDRQSVESSNIKSIGYENGTLEVEFLNGGIFNYENVPPEEHAALMKAESVGKHLHANIKPVYVCRKVGKQAEGK
jgi:hypothetical protein